MRYIFIAFAFIASPAFAQAPQRQSVTDLQAAWNVRAYGEAQAVKALDVILKELEATAKERDALKAELDAIKAKDKPE